MSEVIGNFLGSDQTIPMSERPVQKSQINNVPVPGPAHEATSETHVSKRNHTPSHIESETAIGEDLATNLKPKPMQILDEKNSELNGNVRRSDQINPISEQPFRESRDNNVSTPTRSQEVDHETRESSREATEVKRWQNLIASVRLLRDKILASKRMRDFSLTEDKEINVGNGTNTTHME